MKFPFSTYSSKIETYCQESIELVADKETHDKLTEVELNSLLSGIEKINYSVIDCFNEAILSGDYINDDKFYANLVEYDKAIEESTSTIWNEFSIHPSLPSPTVVEQTKNLNEIASSLLRFLESIQLKFKFHEKRFYINESLFIKFQKFEFNGGGDYFVDLFYANLFVAQCDHFVSNTDLDSLRKLDEIIEFLDSSTAREEIGDKVYKKAYFIRHKITLRYVEELKSKDASSQIYVSKNGKNEVFNPSEVLNETYLEHFKNWNKYLLTHYEIFDDWKYKIQETRSPSQELEILSVLDLHAQIKYAKDVVCNAELLKRIRLVLKTKLQSSNSEADKYAAKVCLSYCYNNEFSFLVQSENPDSVKINELFEEIINCPELAEIKNYFVPAMMLSYKTTLLKLYFEGRTVIENIEKCEVLIKDTAHLTKQFYIGLNWVKTNYNYVFQLPMSECLVNLTDDSKIFVYSSCFLPISRNTLEHRFKKDLEDLRIYKASIENLLITKDNLQEISKLTEEFNTTKAEFEKKESKAIETIVLVSAIMTFVAGSIPGFKFINSGIEAITFTLALGTSLTWFVLLFYSINRGSIIFKQNYWPIILGAILIVISWIMVLIVSPNKKPTPKNKPKIEDSATPKTKLQPEHRDKGIKFESSPQVNSQNKSS